MSLQFDWEFISGKRDFKWAMVCNTEAPKKHFSESHYRYFIS